MHSKEDFSQLRSSAAVKFEIIDQSSLCGVISCPIVVLLSPLFLSSPNDPVSLSLCASGCTGRQVHSAAVKFLCIFDHMCVCSLFYLLPSPLLHSLSSLPHLRSLFSPFSSRLVHFSFASFFISLHPAASPPYPFPSRPSLSLYFVSSFISPLCSLQLALPLSLNGLEMLLSFIGTYLQLQAGFKAQRRRVHR